MVLLDGEPEEPDGEPEEQDGEPEQADGELMLQVWPDQPDQPHGQTELLLPPLALVAQPQDHSQPQSLNRKPRHKLQNQCHRWIKILS